MSVVNRDGHSLPSAYDGHHEDHSCRQHRRRDDRGVRGGNPCVGARADIGSGNTGGRDRLHLCRAGPGDIAQNGTKRRVVRSDARGDGTDRQGQGDGPPQGAYAHTRTVGSVPERMLKSTGETAGMAVPPALARALAFDRGGLAPGPAVRSALGLIVPLVVGAGTGHPADGAMAAAGALPVGVAAMTGTLGAGPAGLLVATTIGMSLSTFVGSLCAGHEAAVAAALAVWGFAAGLFVVLGKAATITGVQAVVGLIVFGRYPGGIGTSALHAGAVLAGGLQQAAYAVLLRPIRPLGRERAALADAYRRLAELAAGGSYGGPSGEAIATASALIARRSRELPTLRDLADEAARVRLELQALSSVPEVAGVAEVSSAAADWLQELARSLSAGAAPGPEQPALADAVAALRAEPGRPGRAGSRQRFATARAAALLGQLRAADRLVAALTGERRVQLPRVAGVRSALQLRTVLRRDLARLRDAATDVDGPTFRHAVRLAVLLPLADVVSTQLPWQRGYWVPLTTVVVLKPDYAATTQRGLARIVGTGLGVVLAGLLVAAARPTGAALVVVVGLLAWASYAVFAASYALFSFVMTALVVLLISTGDSRPLSAVADRGLDTLLGGAIALLGYLAWPTREAPTLRATAAGLLRALAAYADVVLESYAAGGLDQTRTRMAERARDARRARADAQASLDRAVAEPTRLRPNTELALSVLAAARRIVVVLHALRTTLQDTSEHVSLPEIEPVRRAVVTALTDLARAADDRMPVQLPDLREEQHRLEELADAGSGLQARRLGLVAAHLDPLVDAVDTVGHLLGATSTPLVPR